MKIAQYNDMMSYLTRPGFKDGDTVVPPPKPLTESQVKNKLDPRLYNGAILIGLNSPVVKSHGSTDYIGFSYSLDVCIKVVRNNLIQKIKDNIHK